MPSLPTLKHISGYGIPARVISTQGSVTSVQNSIDCFLVKYDTVGKAKWAARIGSIGMEVGYSISSDTNNNVYMIGEFANILSIYNADGTFFGQLANAGGIDVFIIKYNANGTVQWATRIGGTSTDVGFGLSTDSSGNVYVTGYHTLTGTIYNSDGEIFGTLTNAGGSDVFVVKYNTNGTAQWATRIGGTSADIGYVTSTDSSGNVYVAGSYTGTVTIFNTGGGTFGTLTNAGGTDAFVVKYNTDGTAQWATRIGGTSGDIGYGISTDSSGNAYVSGTYTGTATIFNSGGGTFGTLANAGVTDTFVVKYNTNGTAQWATRIGGTSADTGYRISTDSDGNAYVAGSYSATITIFNSGGGTFGTLATAGANDAFVVKYNTNGAAQWATRIGGTFNDEAFTIFTESSGNVYVTGFYDRQPITIFNSGGGTFGTLTGVGGTDAFLVKYNTNGTAQWATRIGSSGDDRGRGIALDSRGNIYVFGQFTGSRFSVYGRALSLFATLPNSGSSDAFVAKYNTNGQPQWAARMASGSIDLGWNTCLDSLGNLYASGTTQGTITVFNADGSEFGTYTMGTAIQGFVTKYTSNGTAQWLVKLLGADSNWPYGITADSNNNIYITGEFRSGTMTMINSDGTTFGTMNSFLNQNGDVFVIKINSDGFFQWAARMFSSQFETAYSIVADSSNNVYVVGNTGTGQPLAVLNSDGTTFATLANAGNLDAFIVKYNTNGFAQWVTRIGGISGDIAYSVAVDPIGNIVVVGSYSGTATVFNSDGTTFGTLAAGGGGDAFVVEYNSNGFVQWATRLAGSAGADIAYSCATDSSGDIYVSGSGTPIIYNSNGTIFRTHTLAGFMVKYNSSGFAQWSIQFNISTIFSMKTDANKNIYACGPLGSDATNFSIPNSDGSTYATMSAPVAVIKYDKNGFVKWVQVVRSIDTTRGIYNAVTSAGDCYFIYRSSASTGSAQLYNQDQTPYLYMTNVGGGAFLVKYSPTASPQWVARTGGTVDRIAAASDGSIYVLGTFGGTGPLVLYNADGRVSSFALSGLSTGTVFLVKYNSSGFVQWATRLTHASQAGAPSARDIALDSSQNVFIVGTYRQGATGLVVYNSDGSIFTTMVNPGAGGNIFGFLVSYTPAGFGRWTVYSTGSSSFTSVATDTVGNSYFCGGYGGTTISNSSIVHTGGTISLAGSSTVRYGFIVKIDSTGTSQASTTLLITSTAGYILMNNLKTDSAGNVYTISIYNGTFGGTASVGDNILITKRDTSITGGWNARISASGANEANSIAVDSGGAVFVTGSYLGTATISNSSGSTFGTLTNIVGTAGDVYVVKYNTNGTALWAARAGAAATNVRDIGNSVAVNPDGDVLVTGSVGGGNAPFIAYNANGSLFGSVASPILGANSNTFLVKYSSSGPIQWMSALGSFASSNSGRCVTTDAGGNIYLVGTASTSFGLIPFDA